MKLYSLISKNQLLKGSFVMVIGSNIANVIAYMYHFVIGRMIGRVEYGELDTFLALIGFLGSLYSFLGLLIMKYSSKGKSEKDTTTSFFQLLDFFHRPVIFLSILLFILTPFFSARLNLPLATSLIIAPSFYLMFLVFVYKSYLQGKLFFGRVSVYSTIEMAGRLGFGVLLIYLGFGVTGASFGLLLSVIPILFFTRRDIPQRLKTKVAPLVRKDLFKASVPVFLTSLATTALFSVDIILVRAFFPEIEVGTYAAASTLGKTVLFATAPITAVLFPLISKKHAGGESGIFMLLLSLVMTFCFGGMFAFIFYFTPQLAVLPFGADFHTAIPYLFPFSIFMLFLVMSLVFVNYYLPKEKYYATGSLVAAAIVQSLGILLFHKTLLEVIYVSLFVTLALFINLLVYFAYENRWFHRKLATSLRHYPNI